MLLLNSSALWSLSVLCSRIPQEQEEPDIFYSIERLFKRLVSAEQQKPTLVDCDISVGVFEELSPRG